ncbi:MAG: hypothetical protein AAFW70_26425 [Cyanobacteria bacterium J06635_10]
MASVQSESEARIAQNLGWRTFRIIAPDAPLSGNEILCRHTKDNATQCEDCMLCDGKSNKPNIADKVHGLKWKISNFVKYSESLFLLKKFYSWFLEKQNHRPKQDHTSHHPSHLYDVVNLDIDIARYQKA